MSFDHTGMENVDIGSADIYIKHDSGYKKLGFLRGDCSLSLVTQMVEVRQGVPRALKGRIITQIDGNVKIECIECTPETYALALGRSVTEESDTPPVEETAYVSRNESTAWPTAHAWKTEEPAINLQEILLQLYPEYDIDWYDFSTNGVRITQGDYVLPEGQSGAYVIVKDAHEENPGWWIQCLNEEGIQDNDVLIRLQVKVLVPQPGNTKWHIEVGGNEALNTINGIVFDKYNPRNGMHTIIQCWKAQSDGNATFAYNMEASQVLGINVNLGLISSENSSHTHCPLCLITTQDSFDINNLPSPPQHN